MINLWYNKIMKINIEVNNKTQSPIEDSFFVKIAQKTIEGSGLDFLFSPAGGKEISVSVALVSEAEMQKLNKKYRQKDNVTDVLSFFEYETIEELKKAVEDSLCQPEGGGIFLGELILCYNDIKKYTEIEGINFEFELAKVFAHGILHLLGFLHGKEMFSLQEKIAGSFGG